MQADQSMKKAQNQKNAATQRSAQASPRRWPRWLLLAGVFLVVAAVSAGVLEYVVRSTLPSALVGKWIVETGGQKGATFDFGRDGTMVCRINVEGRVDVVEGHVRVEGHKMHTTARNHYTGRDDTGIQTIRSLTERELVVEDDRGEVVRMVRVE
jgi:uncharacterized protein (TIGR03066 family)